MENVRIVGCGSYQANTSVSNYDLEKIVETSDEWITQRTGIKHRYVSNGENTSELAYQSALVAIKDANIDPNEIDLIIVATSTPDHFTPSTACMVMEKLGLNGNHVMAFDVSAACTGFIYSIHIASMLLKQYQCALVIGAETLSKIVDYSDRNTCVLFGDGAGAVILKASEHHHISCYCNALGDDKEALIAKGVAMKHPLQNCDKQYSYLQMDGKEVFRFAIKAMKQSIEEVLQQSNHTIDEIDLIIPHQANVRIIDHVRKKMNLSENQVFVNLDEYGNTSAASIAIALHDAKEKQVLKEGMKVVLSGFGAGFTYGAIYLEW